MDKKGITWVGNVYKRFEDMCLDVEEDTIKYVENQFESVGESVRRFYSNVIQDFLPPPNSPESEKNPNANEKHEPSKDENENLTEQDSVKKENELVITLTIEDTIVVSPLIQVCRYMDNSCRPSGLRSRKSRGQVECNYNDDNSFDSSVDENRDPDENLSESTAKSMIESSIEMVTSESIGNNENEIGVRSSNVSSIGGSSQDEKIRDEKYDDEEIFMSHPNQPTKFWSLATKTEPGEESSEKQSDGSKLEETIVVVNEDDLHALPQIECKHTTNKKKIRGLFYSRMRSGRKQEYRQLAMHHGDCENMDKESDDSKKLPSRDHCESEWEIL